MDYKKLYKEALERAKELQHDNCWVTSIFPELKESEDEKIRKDIIVYLQYSMAFDKSFLDKKYNWSQKDCSKWIAWLEKQGEQKPTDKVEPKFKVGDEIKTANEEPLIITKIDEEGYWSEDLFICGFDEECIWDLVEQKPVWSEEDENKVTLFMQLTEGCDNEDELADWLKSLKERYTWKPSDEQMKALWEVYKGGKEQASLATLYLDLKKLRDEQL